MRSGKSTRAHSLSLKVLLAFLAGTVLSIALVVVVAFAAIRSDLLARTDLVDLAQDLASKVRFDGHGQPVGLEPDEDKLAWIFDSLQRETGYRVLDADGQVVLRSGNGPGFWPSGGDAVQQARDRFEFEHDGAAMFGATSRMENAGRNWYLQVVASARLMELLHRVALPLVGVGILVFSLVMLLAFGLLAFVTLRYTLKPLRDLSDSAAAIAPKSIHARLKTDAVPAEIAPLVESFNHVLERLERGYRLQQEFLGNAAHELKTPLALIRAQIELREDGENDRASLLSDVEYMTRQVQQLLRLAEVSDAHNYLIAPVRMGEVTQEVVAYLQRMAEAAKVSLAVPAGDVDVIWYADRGALFTLLKNLLENAIQHAPAGTDVRVDVQTDSMTVRDFGPGVDLEHLPLLSQRFWRGAHRRDLGAGLGLAICQEIAMAHGWDLSAERADPGMRFRLSVAPRGDGEPWSLGS